MPGSGKYRLPAGVQARPIAQNFSDWICIGSLTKAPDQAWALMQYLVEPGPLLTYCESRYFQPPRKSIANEGFMKQPHLQRMVQVFDKYGQAQIRVPNQPVFIQTLTAMGQDVYDGKVAPRAALDQAARALRAEVDKSGVKWTTL